MEAQTYKVAAAIGSREAVDLILEALEAPGGVNELADRAGVEASTASRRLKELANSGVLSKKTAKSAYEVTCPEPTRRFLEALSALAKATLEERAAAEKEFERRIRKTRLRRQGRHGSVAVALCLKAGT